MEVLLGFFQNILLFLILFGILVFIHEFGHFIVAKAVGVGVEKFFLGFGPKMFSLRRGETEYGVNWVFLGGFVKLVGEEPGEEAGPIPKEKSFVAKPPLARIAVVSAGPISNFLLPVILFCFLFMIGMPSLAPVVGEVIEKSPAYVAGLKQGDRVLSVNGQSVSKWDDLTKLIRRSEGKEIVFDLERAGKRINLKVTPRLSSVTNIFRETVQGWTVGITPYQYKPAIGITSNRSTAYRAGLRKGDVVTKIDDKDVKYYWQFVKYFREAKSEFLAIEVNRQRIKDWEELSFGFNRDLTREQSAKDLGIYDAAKYLLDAEPLSVAVVGKSKSFSAGLRDGDVIRSVNGRTVKSFSHFAELVSSSSWQTLDIAVSRPKNVIDDKKLFRIKRDPRKHVSPRRIGIRKSQLFISKVSPVSIAAEKGIKPGDMIASIDGKRAYSWLDLEKAISANKGEPINITLRRDKKRLSISLTPKLITDKDRITGADEQKRELGIEPLMLMMDPSVVEILEKTSNPFKAAYLGIEKTFTILSTQVLGLVKLIQGKLSVKNIGGPILIYKLAGKSFEVGGVFSFISYIALLSIVLGFVNLLPIPIMDGGHIVFYTIEMIYRKPLGLRTREIAQQVGFIIVIGLMLLATYNDIKRYFFSGIAEFFKRIF